jgi:hypothetical protein
MYDEQAKIRLRDGREVWRKVYVRYRDVETGVYVSAEEVEALQVAPVEKLLLLDRNHLREQIAAVHSETAVKPDGGSQSVQAAKLVLGVLKSMDQDERSGQEDQPWFVLGRDLAVQLLEIIASLEIGEDRAVA